MAFAIQYTADIREQDQFRIQSTRHSHRRLISVDVHHLPLRS
ncbi:Uncharacterised protein [Vibrio cholerae]|nr:Uncharacterised protein [Vibrio cholerae]CSI49748.1 Uncharacterised protein [Vibrio cholerae]